MSLFETVGMIAVTFAACVGFVVIGACCWRGACEYRSTFRHRQPVPQADS